MSKQTTLIGLIGLCLLLVISGPVYGQGLTTGSIAGTAKDTTGGVLPGVTITLTHTATGRVRTTITGDEGRYLAPSLGLGTYQVAAELVGFQTLIQSDLKLELGAQLVLDFVLSPGNITERVTVTGEAALVETTSSTIGGLVDDKKIRDLPLNGRDYVQLATLEAGVYRTRMGRAYDVHRGAGTQISINGARVDQNLFVQDGTTTNDFFGMTPGGVSGDSLGVEAIREFRVLTHNFSAEYGQAGGAVITTVSKSGGNEFHGNVFEFHRNSALDARNFFDRGADPPGFKKNQFGFTIGGPIVKEQTFFFGSYEGLRQRLATSAVADVPNDAAHQGLLPVGEVANCTDPRPGGLCFVGVDADIVPFLDLYPRPSPGGRDNGDGTAEFFRSPTVPIGQDQFTIKIDHTFSDSDSMFGRYLFDDSDTKLFSSVNLGFVRESKVRRQMVTLQETHIFSPNLLNVARLGFNRAWTGQFNGGPLGTDFDPSLSFVTGRPMGSILIPGVSSIGSSVASDLVRINNSFEYGDDLTYTRGNHSMKFGATWRRIQSNGENGIRAVGSHTFADLEAFFKGNSGKIETILPGSDLIKGWRQNIIGLYFQDDIKYRSNLTLNLGLRYEFITVPTEVNGKMSNILDPFSPTAVSQAVDPYFQNPSLKNFGPRVGVAWDPFGNGNTSVRLGGGLFFDQFSSKVIFTSGWQGLPFYARINVPNPPFPGTGFEQLPLADLLTAVEEGPIKQDFTNAYQMQYNLSIQHALNNSTSLQVGYVGTLGRHLSRIQQTNNNQYILCPCPDDPLTPNFDETTAPAGAKYHPVGTTRPNQLTQIIGMKAFDTNSSYNALQVTLSRRFTDGLQFQVAYAWSKNLSESPGQNGGSSGGITTTMDPEDRKRNRSRAPFDVRQDLTMNYTYDLPFGSGFAGAAGKFLSGWQLGGIIHIADGSPHLLNLGRGFSFQPSRSGNHNGPDGNTDRPSLLPGKKVTIREDFDPATGYYDPSVFVVAPGGFWGDLEKNAGTTPGEATFDLSVVKQTTVGERTAVQFRAEFFNIFNRANFGTPRGQVFRSSGPDSRFGQIRSTFTTNRQIQFALKISF